MIAYSPAPTLLDHHGGQAQWFARNVSPARVSCGLQEAEIGQFVLAPVSPIKGNETPWARRSLNTHEA